MLGREQNGRCVEEAYWLMVTSNGRRCVRDIKRLFAAKILFFLVIHIKVELNLVIAG